MWPAMGSNILLESLVDCKSKLEDLQQSTKDRVALHDEFWAILVAERLDNQAKRICHLHGTVGKYNDRRSQQSIINNAQDVFDTIKQAALHYDEQGLQKLLPSSSNDEWIHTKETILQPSLQLIARHITILEKMQALMEQDLAARDIQTQLVSLNIKDFRQLYAARISTIDLELRKASFSTLRRGGIQFGNRELEWFWETIPCPKRLYKDRLDRADGVLIGPQHITKTRERLNHFRSAWLEVNNTYATRPSDETVLTDLVGMAKIVCVLRGCRMHDHLNTLLGIPVTDRALVDQDLLDQLRRWMPEEDADVLFGEFSRVRERKWDRHEHLVLRRHEPLPLISGRELRGSSVSNTGVSEAVDAWDQTKKYAHKIVLRDDYEETRRQRLDNEIQKLSAISKEAHGHHIVECVKTYRRGNNEIGMLLLPVADTDLADILERCSNSLEERQTCRVHLIRALGCLTYAMCYLHNVKDIRHYDVKPGNVLVHFAAAAECPVFLWADFGLAFGFRGAGFSGSRNVDFVATAAYEPTDKEFHSRAHDVYGLGCIFLEVVSVLSMTGVRDRVPVHQFRNYRENLDEVRQWSDDQVSMLRERKEGTLRKILQLTKDMMLQDRKHRPKIHEVFERLRGLENDRRHEGLFCSSCIAKIDRDTSKKPQHPHIFVHKSTGRSNDRSSWSHYFRRRTSEPDV